MNLEIIMNSSLDKALEIQDEEFFITLFDPDYQLPEAKKQILRMIKETVQKLDKCHQQYLKLLRTRNESLSTIIFNSK